jgi:hypothetical protein
MGSKSPALFNEVANSDFRSEDVPLPKLSNALTRLFAKSPLFVFVGRHAVCGSPLQDGLERYLSRERPR